MNKERAAAEPVLFTPDELTLLGDTQFFRAKARIMTKMKAVLEGVYEGLQRELAGVTLLAPAGFNPATHLVDKDEQPAEMESRRMKSNRGNQHKTCPNTSNLNTMDAY